MTEAGRQRLWGALTIRDIFGSFKLFSMAQVLHGSIAQHCHSLTTPRSLACFAMKLPKPTTKGIPKKPLPKSAPIPRPSPPQAIPQFKPVWKGSVPKAPVKKAPAPKPLPFKEPGPSQLAIQEREAEETAKAEKHTSKVNRWRQFAMWGAGLAAFGIGMYSVQLWVSLNKEGPVLDLPAELIDRFDKDADGYDEKVGIVETLMLLNSKRKALTQKIHGNVLEVAVGTGRNFAYYPTKKCNTVTLLDASAPMLAVAKRKWKDEQPEYFHRVFFKHQSALDPITPPFDAQGGYDTVLQTMGLCSTPEPVRLLRNLEAATKEDGQILLLEHGKSHYDWLNKLLDKTAPQHADEHGCWWNKDIGKIVEESGLEVVNIKRYNFGTTWWVELKPRKGMRQKRESAAVQQVAAENESQVTRKPWWNPWN
jgi:methyltransferase OMS1